MLEIDRSTLDLLDGIEPPLPHKLREAVIAQGLATTHKDAHEGFVDPYLKYLAAQGVGFAALKPEVVS